MKYIKTIIAIVATAVSLAVPSVTASAHASSGDCLDGKNTDNYVASFTRGTGTIATKDGKPLCASADLYLQSFQLPKTWDGKGWNTTAIPQTLHAAVPFTVPAGVANFKKTLNIAVPDACHATQLDFYLAPKVPAIINFHDGEDREILGKIFKATGECYTPKPIKVCELATKQIITIDEKDFNSAKHSKNLDACKEVTVTIKVCELATKQIIMINEKDFNASKHSKNLNDCAVIQPNKIKVCELSTKQIIMINEKDFNASKHSKNLNDCATAPVVTPTTPEQLPNTGIGSIAGIFGLTTLLGTIGFQLKQRFSRR